MEVVSDRIRNVALISYSQAGKSSLAEAMLYVSGAIPKLGKVSDGSSSMDYLDEEKKRKISIFSSIASIGWEDHKINLIDTPGDQSFVVETQIALDIADLAIVLISAESGIKGQCERLWAYADKRSLPRMIFINKLDSDKASYETAFGQVSSTFKEKMLKFTLPIGSGSGFKGVVDLIFMKAFIYKRDKEGTFQITDIPDNLRKWAEKERKEIVEFVAERDEALMDQYFKNDTIKDEDLFKGIRKAVLSSELVPVLCGSATENIVVRKTLNAIVQFAPSPLDRVAYKGYDKDSNEVEIKVDKSGLELARVFKTVIDPYAGKISYLKVISGTLYPDTTFVNKNKDSVKEHIGAIFTPLADKLVPANEACAGDIVLICKLKSCSTGDSLANSKYDFTLSEYESPDPVVSMAIEPESKSDDERLSVALGRLKEEDIAIKVEMDTEIKEMILSGMGKLHIDTVVDKLFNKYNIKVNLHPPRIAYKETIKSVSEGHGRLKKQTGGHGQFADCKLRIEPLENGEGFEFASEIVGGVVPKQYIPGVEKGVIEAMKKGSIAGYPVVGVKAVIFDGKYHEVDSSEMAFKTAAIMAFKDAYERASAILLEPIMELEIIVPDDAVGDIMSDISRRRGQILSLGVVSSGELIKAMLPLSEVFGYEQELSEMTGGRGEFSISFSSYKELPDSIAKKVIESKKTE